MTYASDLQKLANALHQMDSMNAEKLDILPLQEQLVKSMPVPAVPLVGAELLQKEAEMDGLPYQIKTRAYGYVDVNGRENFTACYEALCEAKGIDPNIDD